MQKRTFTKWINSHLAKVRVIYPLLPFMPLTTSALHIRCELPNGGRCILQAHKPHRNGQIRAVSRLAVWPLSARRVGWGLSADRDDANSLRSELHHIRPLSSWTSFIYSAQYEKWGHFFPHFTSIIFFGSDARWRVFNALPLLRF